MAQLEPSYQPSKDERSIAQLFSDLTRDTTDIMRKEIELARLEFSESIATLRNAIVTMAAGGAVLFAGFLVLLAAAVFGLNVVLQQLWLSALIVGAVVVTVGAAMVGGGGKRLKDQPLAPERSPRSLKRDKDVIQRHL